MLRSKVIAQLFSVLSIAYLRHKSLRVWLSNHQKAEKRLQSIEKALQTHMSELVISAHYNIYQQGKFVVYSL